MFAAGRNFRPAGPLLFLPRPVVERRNRENCSARRTQRGVIIFSDVRYAEGVSN